MNPIQQLQTILEKVVPEAKLEVHAPSHADGFWWLDVRLDDYFLVIQWAADFGFGLVADPDHGYGEPADEHYKDFSTALPRIIRLVQNRLETVPPYPVRIRELREKMGLTQEDIATQMGVNQAAVSKLEAREDSHVSTLQNYAKALGGHLVMKMVFGDREEEILIGPNG